MTIRFFLSVVVVCSGLMMAVAPVSSAFAEQAQPTALELYEQGVQAFEAGEIEQARQLFRRVDPMQLPREQREAYYEALRQIDNGATQPQPNGQPANGEPAEPMDEPAEPADEPTEPAEPAEPPAPTAVELLAQADETADRAQARALYAQVLEHEETTESLKARAQARIAHLDRQANPQAMTTREQIDLAMAALEEGDLRAAERYLGHVQQSGASLGWFDQQRVNRARTVIAEHRLAAVANGEADPAAEAEETPGPDQMAEATPAQEPATDEQADEDVLATLRAVRMQESMARAEAAETAGQYALAVRHYESALQDAPDNAEVRTRLNAALAMLQQEQEQVEPGERSPIETDIRIRQINREAALVQYENAMNRARAARDAGNYAQARDHVSEAKLALDQNQRFFSQIEYRDLRSAANRLDDQIEVARQEAEMRRQAEIARQQELESAREAQEAQVRRRQDVDRLMREAMELRKDMRHAEALERIERVLVIEPTNYGAQALKEVLQDNIHLIEARTILRERNIQWTETQLQNLEATTPFSQIIRYPADWPELTERRLAMLDASGGESEANRRVALKLQEPINIEFDNNRLINVIEFLRNMTGLNFVVFWQVLEQAGVSQDTPITLQLRGIRGDQALNLILRQASPGDFDRVGYSIIDGIVTISTERDLSRTMDTRIYDIKDLLIQAPDFGNPPQFDLESALDSADQRGGGGTGGGGGGAGQGGLFGQTQQGDSVIPRVSREEMIRQITELIMDSVGDDPLGWADRGGDWTIRELNGNLIVRTTPGNQREIIDLLSQLREERAIQIAVEARILLVEQNFLEEIGVDFDITIDGLGSNFGPIQIVKDNIDLGQRGTTTSTPSRYRDQSGEEDSDAVFNRSFGVNFSYLNDLEVNLILQATQASARSLSLTAPRITLLNGNNAWVMVARQIAFISDLEPIPNAAGFDPTIGVVSSGVVLYVQGTVSADRRYVTMDIRPSLATVREPIRQVPITGTSVIGGGGQQPGEPTTFSGLLEVPEVEITQLVTFVSVPDRGTLLLGGQRLVGEVEFEAGVPVLSKIPVISRLFTNNSIVKDERTLLILVKPTIIIQSEQEELLFPGLGQSPADWGIGR